MTSYIVDAAYMALARETKAGKSIWSLQYGPSQTGAQIVERYPKRKGFCLGVQGYVTGHNFPLRVLYCLREKDINEEGEGAVVSFLVWEARKADFIRSFGEQIKKHVENEGEIDFDINRSTLQVVSIAQRAAAGACWEVRIFCVTDVVIETSDPFDV